MSLHNTDKLQLELLKEYPLRPTLLTLDLDSAYTVIADAAPVTWASDNLRVGHGGLLNITDKKMDDDAKATIASDIAVNLFPGIYEVRVNLHFVEGAAAAEDVIVAITNLAGSTVFHASDAIEVPASGDMHYRMTQICQITAVSDGIAIRAALQSAGTVTVQPGHIGYIRRIGNDGEA